MNQELYRTEDLEAIVQASRNEILESLSKFKAFLYRGYWRILSEDAEYDVVDQMQLIIRAEGWAWNEVPATQLIAQLSREYPTEVVAHVVRHFTTPNENTPNKLTVLKDRMAIVFASKLLRSKSSWELQEFITAWKTQLPSEVSEQVDISLLYGLALFEELSTAKTRLSYFPEWKLPLQPQQRFKELFAAKPKWKLEEIRPYLRELITPDQSEDQLLLAYARVSTSPTGLKFYSAR